MTKDEMRELLRTCKAIYSRFEGAEKVDGQIRILNEVVDAWHNAIGWMSFDEAHMILTKHTVSEAGDKAPTLKTFVTGGKVQKDAGRFRSNKFNPKTFINRRYNRLIFFQIAGNKHKRST